VEML